MSESMKKVVATRDGQHDKVFIRKGTTFLVPEALTASWFEEVKVEETKKPRRTFEKTEGDPQKKTEGDPQKEGSEGNVNFQGSQVPPEGAANDETRGDDKVI